MAFCANCGSERPDGAGFCGKCGAAGGAGAAPTYSAPPTYAAPAGGAVPTIVTLALVFAFLAPLVGMILALVGKSEAERIGGLAASRNRLALTLSVVFLIIGTIAFIMYIGTIVALMSNGYY
ncbi:MAG: zinc-ribbon domain [Actinomycetota bacterium]|jgi:hypothetical protein